jgi:hypothetical protein
VDESPDIREVLMFCTKISVQNIRTSLISGDPDARHVGAAVSRCS